MTKNQVIFEVLAAIRTALDEKLEHEHYSQYLKGRLSIRLDLIPGPEKRCVTLYLPSAKDAAPPALTIQCLRRYARRHLELPLEVNDAHEERGN